MIKDAIPDGKPHAIDRKYGYILLNVDDEIVLAHPDFDKYLEPLASKYSEYIKESIMSNPFLFDENYTLIYRPPFGDEKPTLAIRFKRVPNDNLDPQNEHV